MKFKVWDKVNSNWLDFAKYKAVLGNDGKIYNAHQGLHANEDWLPFFSTGTHDENGMELFDGDIVKMFDRICEVCFDKAGYHTISGKELKQYASDCKKIGNKLENPKLLE